MRLLTRDSCLFICNRTVLFHFRPRCCGQWRFSSRNNLRSSYWDKRRNILSPHDRSAVPPDLSCGHSPHLFADLVSFLNSSPIYYTVLIYHRWALARDNATPFHELFSTVNETLSCPIPAALFCVIISIGLGAIPLGSKVAFTDLAGSFIILTSVSYALAIAPHLFTGRKNVPKGPFHLGKAGYVINAAAVLLIIFFDIIYCLRKYFWLCNYSVDVLTSY